MPTILYWNIENFSLNKIADDTAPPDADYGYDGDGQGSERLQFITDVLTEAFDADEYPIDLDFIVIVEVQKGTRRNNKGYYVNANAREGILQLYDAIAEELDIEETGDDWRLVPPIVLGKKGKGEGIAVFYNSRKWYFLGPKLANGAYTIPDAYDGSLRHRRIPPDYGIAINRGRYEDELRGQWQFMQRTLFGREFSIRFPGRNDRAPWLTYFGSVGGAPNTLVRLMGFHSSPANAADGVSQLSNIATMMDNNRVGGAARQIDVIVGDFNVDNFNDDNFNDDGPFSNLVDGAMAPNPANPAYTALIRPPADIDPIYRGYYATEANPLDRSSIENIAEEPDGTYPGYGYATRSIDNAFVRHLGFPVAPPDPNTTIANRVVDTRFAWPPSPPPAPPVPLPMPYPPRGVYSYLDDLSNTYSSMNQTIAELLHDDGDDDVNELFRAWENFGHIRSTSDHMPLIFQV